MNAPDVASAESQLRVLMLEDVPTDAELCEHELRRAGLKFIAQRVDTKAGFEKALQAFSPDLIISDFSMPGAFDGLGALDLARERAPDTPFVFVSGTIGEERAVEAMKRGATDYVLKDRLNRLVPVIKRALQERAERMALRHAEHQLGETRGRLDRILASLVDVVWSVSTSPSQMLYVNQAAEALYGRPASDFFANSLVWLEAVHPDDRERVSSLWDRTLKGETFDAEYRILTPAHEQRWIHNRGQAVRDAEGRVIRVDGLARDVTQRRSHEERIARLSRVRTVLSGIDAAIVRIKDKQQLYSDACHIAVYHGGFKLAWIGDVDSETLKVHPRASCGEHEEFLDGAISIDEASSGEGGLIGVAVREGRPTTSNDLAADERLVRPEENLRRGYQSVAMLPLKVADRVTAVLALYAVETGFFDDEEMKLLEELASNLSFALDYTDKASRLDHLAYYDALTGLPNRNLFRDRLAQLVSRAAAEESEVVVVMIDFERFRSINEAMGTAAGDAVLRRAAARFERAAGELGTSARITADHFVLALPRSAHGGETVHAIVERLQQSFDVPFQIEGEGLRLQAKVGIAVYPADAESPETLLANAEAALKNAKSSGEKFAFYAREMNARVAHLMRLENQLRVAAREEQFVLYYQPRISLPTGEVCGMEALIRWRHPELGLVPPGDFIPILEETGLILDVGRWALRRAAADTARWREQGLETPSIGVNVSALQLRQKDFVSHVAAAIAEGAGSHNSIEIELTESMVMSDVEANARKLAEIRAAGIRIAIDDFGTGYSSLSYLAMLPVDMLKIDRSFISPMSSSPVHMAIVTTVISLARSLHLTVVAEGVETEEQANLLRLLRCDEAQGFLYSKPLPPEEVPGLLQRAGTKKKLELNQGVLACH